MGTVGIFIIGSVVPALVGGALTLLVYGAKLDGRTDAQADAVASQLPFDPTPLPGDAATVVRRGAQVVSIDDDQEDVRTDNEVPTREQSRAAAHGKRSLYGR